MPTTPLRRLAPAIALLLSLAACAAPSAPVKAQAPGLATAGVRAVSGTVKRHPGVASRHLKRDRDVYVYLPPGYEAAGQTRYPVLYMHDGNNLFDGGAAFGGHEWQVDESLERLISAGELPPMIVVGVGNTADRTREYTWVPGLLGGERIGGDGPQYGRFLTEELKPLVDRTYRTKTDRANTGVMGSSLGGLVSLYLGKHHGQVFGKLGVMSPSVWWSDRAVLEEGEGLRRDLKIWLDMGHREGQEPQTAIANARALKDRLVQRGYTLGRDLSYHEDREGGHDERAWAYRFPMAVKFLFGR